MELASIESCRENKAIGKLIGASGKLVLSDGNNIELEIECELKDLTLLLFGLVVMIKMFISIGIGIRMEAR